MSQYNQTNTNTGNPLAAPGTAGNYPRDQYPETVSGVPAVHSGHVSTGSQLPGQSGYQGVNLAQETARFDNAGSLGHGQTHTVGQQGYAAGQPGVTGTHNTHGHEDRSMMDKVKDAVTGDKNHNTTHGNTVHNTQQPGYATGQTGYAPGQPGYVAGAHNTHGTHNAHGHDDRSMMDKVKDAVSGDKTHDSHNTTHTTHGTTHNTTHGSTLHNTQQPGYVAGQPGYVAGQPGVAGTHATHGTHGTTTHTQGTHGHDDRSMMDKVKDAVSGDKTHNTTHNTHGTTHNQQYVAGQPGYVAGQPGYAAGGQPVAGQPGYVAGQPGVAGTHATHGTHGTTHGTHGTHDPATTTYDAHGNPVVHNEKPSLVDKVKAKLHK